MKKNFTWVLLSLMCVGMLTGCGQKLEHIDGEVMNGSVVSLTLSKNNAAGDMELYIFSVDSHTKLSGVKHVYDLKSGQIVDVGFIWKGTIKMAKSIRVKN